MENILFGGGLVLSGFANLTFSRTDSITDGRFPISMPEQRCSMNMASGGTCFVQGRVRMTTPFVGERFSPMLWSYLPSSAEQGLAGNGLILWRVRRSLEALNICATYQNALNSSAFTVAGYPQYPTVLRLTISATILGIRLHVCFGQKKVHSKKSYEKRIPKSEELYL